MPPSPVVDAVLAFTSLLGLAIVLYVATRRLRLPFAVTLVLLGLALGELIRRYPELAPLGSLQLSEHVLIYIFLPTLIFEAAFATDSRLLLRNIVPVLVLAVPALLVSFVVVGFGLHWAIGLPLGAALLFGAMISPTDGSAMLAVFREMGAPKRLSILAEGENLFNDATAIVLFRLVAAAVGLPFGVALLGGDGAVAFGAWLFVQNFFGGALVGLGFGYLVGKLIGIIENDDLIEILLTTVAAYLSFLFAELAVGVSGVMAVVGTGLVLSGWGRTKFSPPTVEYLTRFWGYLAFVANSLIFLLLGLALDPRVLPDIAAPILWTIVIALVARALGIFALFPVVNRLPGVERADHGHQAAMVWGGLRGAMTLVLVMSLPEDYAYRELFMGLAFGAVLFSLVCQGATLELVIRGLGLDRATLPERYVRDESLLSAKTRARERIDEMRRGGLFSDRVVGELERSYADEQQRIRSSIDSLRGVELLGSRDEAKLLKRQYLLVEKRSYLDLFHRGQLSEKVLKELHHSIELQIDYLRSGGLLPPWTIHSPTRWKIEAALFSVLDTLLPGSEMVQRWRLNRIADRYEEHWGRLMATERVLEELSRMAAQPHAPLEGLEELRELYQRWHANARQRLDSIGEQFPEYATKVQQLMAARLCLQAEEEVIGEMERLEVLPERDARAMRDQVYRKLRRLRQKPLEELKPRPAELLAKVPFFRGLPPEEFEQIVPLLRPRTYLADELVMREGDLGDSMYLVGRGVVRVLVGGNGVAEVPIATLLAGDFFGEMALLTGNPRTATVAAATHCTLYQLRREDLQRIRSVCPTIDHVLEAAYEERRDRAPA